MKRQCNEQEKEILFRNRYNFYEGIFSIKARSNGAKYLWMFLGGAIMSAVIYKLFARIIPVRALTSFVRVFTIIGFVFFGIVTAAIYEVISVSKAKKKFLRSNVIFINGATIVGFDHEHKRILYVEDDVLDKNGEIVLLAYPAEESEVKGILTRKRVLIIYDKDGNYHMMKSNEQFNRFFNIPESVFISDEELMKKEPIPTVNVFYIDKDERALSFYEKELFPKKFAKSVMRGNLIAIALLGVFLMVMTMYWAVLFGRTEGTLHKAVTVGVIICIGICLAIFISYWVMLYHYRIKYKYTHVKELVIHSIENKTLSEFTAKVFEWDVNRLELKEYKNLLCTFSAKYGEVLYRLRTSANEYIILPKEDFLEKKCKL